MKRLVTVLILLMSVCPAGAKHLYKESVYQQVWCDKHGGVTEYKLNDKTRVDCLTDKYAVELDFAPKWAECVGQAIYYGRQTGRQGACVLIMERGKKDLKYLKRLRRAAYRKGVNLKTFTMQPSHVCDPSKDTTCPHTDNVKRR